MFVVPITDIVNQKVASKYLETACHKVEIAENGTYAVDAVKKKCYDVILMDVSMPMMGGIEATSLIRKYEEENGLERVPIIALTAHAMLGDREKVGVNFLEASLLPGVLIISPCSFPVHRLGDG